MPPRPRLLPLQYPRSVWMPPLAGFVLLAGVVAAASAVNGAPPAKRAPAPAPKTEVKRQFFYNGGAAAVGGVIRRIGRGAPEAPLMTQAPALLTRSGGKSFSEIKDFRYGQVEREDRKIDVLRVGHALSDVEGTRNEKGCYVTRVKSVVEDLSVLDRLKAKVVAVELETTHCLEDGRDAVFRNLRCEIADLTIDGVPVSTPCNDYFSQGRTLAEVMADHRAGKGTLLGPDGARLAFPRLMAARRPAPAAYEDRAVLTSLFPKIGEKELPELEKGNKYKDRHFERLDGNGIYIPHFGKVYFGPVLMKRAERHVTMLHLALGSPVEGDVDVGSDYGDGSGYP